MPNKRIRDLKGSADNARLRFRRQTSFRQNTNRDTDLAMILSAYALDHIPLHQSVTEEGVNEFWNKNMQLTSELADGFVRSMQPEQLREEILRADGGRALDRSFARYIPQVDRLPEGLEPRLYPTAGERIDRLKERAARGDFSTPEAKRLCLAEILAAREVVGAGRGGRIFADNRLTGRLNPTVHEKSDAALEQLRKLPDEEIDRLFRMVPNRGNCGAMQEAYESLRKTPAEMEMMRLRRRVLDMGFDSENLKRAAAEMIWLEKQNKLPKEQQAAALEKRERREEINAIRNSPDFTQLLKNRNGADLYKMIGEPNAGQLAACYEEAGREVHESPFAALYDSLRADPQKKQEFEQLFDRLAGREDLEEKLPGDGLPFRWKNKMQRVDTERMLTDKQYFVETMEMLQSGACAAVDEGGNMIRDSIRDDPDLGQLAGMLQLPPPNTAGDFALMLKGRKMLMDVDASSEDDEIYLRRVALHEKVGTGPNWKQKPLSHEDKEAIELRFQELYRNADKYIQDGSKDIHRGESDREFSHMVIHGQPRELITYYNEWKEEQEARLEAEKKVTARERLDQLLQFPSREKLRNSGIAEPLDIARAFHSVLAARAVAREAAAHPEKFASRDDVDREYQRLRIIYRDSLEVAPKKPTIEQMGSMLMKRDDGEAIERAFRTAIRGETSKRLFEVPKEDLPSLKSHIESMQDQVKKGVLDKYDQKNCVAQIIAARQTMNIRPGGDPALNNQLTPKALKRAGDILPILERMPPEEFDALYSKVRQGHGGELMKSFSKICTYENYLRDLKNKAAKSNKQQPEIVAQLMVATMQTANPNNDPKDPVSVEGVLKASAAIQKSPAFAEMMKDPRAQELAKQGNGMALIEKLAQTQKSMDEAEKEKNRAVNAPGVQPKAVEEKDAPEVLQTV